MHIRAINVKTKVTRALFTPWNDLRCPRPATETNAYKHNTRLMWERHPSIKKGKKGERSCWPRPSNTKSSWISRRPRPTHPLRLKSSIQSSIHPSPCRSSHPPPSLSLYHPPIPIPAIPFPALPFLSLPIHPYPCSPISPHPSVPFSTNSSLSLPAH